MVLLITPNILKITFLLLFLKLKVLFAYTWKLEKPKYLQKKT
jgi:hypothetical protein